MIEKKNAGCGIFYKNLSSNRRSKSRMESDNLEEPLVFNYTIASSYHLGDLFLSFFLLFLQKTCFNALHLQAVQRRLKEMRVRMAEDLCQRIVRAEAKWSFPLLALKKGKIILPKFLFFFGQMRAIYQSKRVPNNLLIVGTFSEALVKLATPPFPPQCKQSWILSKIGGNNFSFGHKILGECEGTKRWTQGRSKHCH